MALGGSPAPGVGRGGFCVFVFPVDVAGGVLVFDRLLDEICLAV